MAVKDRRPELELQVAQAADDATALVARFELAQYMESVDHFESCVLFDTCYQLALKLKDRLSEAKALEGMGRMLRNMNDLPKAHRRYQEALSIYTELGDFEGLASSYSGIGIVSSMSEDHSVGLEYFEKALSAAKSVGNESFSMVIIANIGNVYFNLGMYEDAMICFERALAYHEKHNNLSQIVVMLSGIAGIMVYKEEYSKGLTLLQRALNIDRDLGRTQGVVMSLYNIGLTQRKQNKYELALRSQLEVLELATKLKYQKMIDQAHEQLSMLYGLLEDAERAEYHLQQILYSGQEDKNWVVRKQNEKLLQYRMNRSED